MKKILCLAMIVSMIGSSFAFGVTAPDPIDDYNLVKSEVYKSDVFSTPKPIGIGGSATGYVGQDGFNGKANVDVYRLVVDQDTLATFKVTPLEKLYGTNLSVTTLYFVDDVSGQKKRYGPSTIGQEVSYQNYPSYGHYVRSVYLHKGVYYFTVAGGGYSKAGFVSNDQKRLPYKIDVVGHTFLQESNGDTSYQAPLVIQGNSVINGTLNMTHGWGGDRFYSDGNDYIKIGPSPTDLNVKIRVENIKSQPLELFKKKIQYVRNEGEALETGQSVDTGVYKDHLSLSVNLEGVIGRLNPGESTELSALVKSTSTNRTIQLMASAITQYKVTLVTAPVGQEAILPPVEEPMPLGDSTAVNDSTTVNDSTKAYKPIIMLHTGDDGQLPASLLDNRNYKIYVNNEDYTTTMKGYMGHITNLPASDVGDVYNVKVLVEGYKPYYETITIEKPESGFDHPVIFMTVMASKEEGAVSNGFKIQTYNIEQTDSRDGQLIQEGTSLKMVGGSHTNNRIVNGRRDGNAVLTKEKMNFMNKRLDISFTVYGDSYAYFTAGVDKVHTGKGATTHHSWAGSIPVSNGMRLYKSLVFTGNTYQEYLCTGAYYGNASSTVLFQTSGSLSEAGQENIKTNQSVYVGFGDNYGGTNAAMTVHEIKVSSN